MSDFYIYINLEEYLAQWLLFDSGGELPIRFPNGSSESKLMKFSMMKRPANIQPQAPDESNISIEIPYFRFKPPHVYNYLPKKAVGMLKTIIRTRFDVDLWTSLSDFELRGEEKKELIYAWMESRGIEGSGKNWDAVSKRLREMKESYAARKRSKKNYNSKKTV